jgi:hypothetical protein
VCGAYLGSGSETCTVLQFSFRIMELERRNKKTQSTMKSSRKYAKGKSNFTIFENKPCLQDAGRYLEKGAEYLKSKSDTHGDESPTLQRDEVESHFVYNIFKLVVAHNIQLF